jgi:PAS domain S-box-containing protein
MVETRGTRASILIVDDVPSNLLALSSCLAPLGHEMVLAHSGEEALGEVLRHDFAVILLDVVMPGMDGFETASLIRQRDRSRLTPIIFLTAGDRLSEQILRGYSVGAVDYIHKPVNPEILQSKVRVFAELHEKSQRLLWLEQREHDRRLAEVQAQRNRFFSISLDMMCIAGLDGRFQEMNPAWESCLGIPPASLQDALLFDLVHEDDREMARAAWEGLGRQEGRAMFECRCRHSDGTYRWLSWHVQAVRRERCCYAAVRDITGMKEALEQLSCHARDLSLINADLEQFAYIAAHDLREPLRMVASCVMLLERRLRGTVAPENDELIRFAVEGSRRMHQLIGDLLSYSRLRREEHAAEPVDVGRIVEMALFNLRQAIEESRAAVQVGVLPSLRGHPAQLQVLFQNLIENALKYRGEAPPEIRIQARSSEEGWEFSVQDNGIGIKPQHHDRVFRIFQRLHDRVTHPGSGMGLAIAKKVVERHGGRIWLDSGPGEGTTFYFTIPAAPARQEEGRIAREAG